MDGYIYKFTNKINGKVYIGQTTNIKKRYSMHLRYAKTNPQQTIQYAIAKHGIENFTFEILHKVDSSLLSQYEQMEIEKHNSYNDGYNNTLGGESTLGFHHSEETKKKLSEISKKHSAEISQRVSKALTGRKMPEAEKQMRRNIMVNIAGKAAVEWHKSPEGLAWHKQQGERLRGKDFKSVLQHTCQWCGGTYYNKSKKDTYCCDSHRKKAKRAKLKNESLL